MPDAQSSTQEITNPVLDWLTSLPSENLSEEVRSLAANLDALYSPTIPANQFERNLELFHVRAMRLSSELRQQHRHMMFPLPEEALFRARSFADSLKRVAQGFEKTLLDAQADRRHPGLPHRQNTLPGRAIRLLAELYLILGQVGFEPDPQVWKLAYRLFLLSGEQGQQEISGAPSDSAIGAFKFLLALTTLAPQSLSAAELDWASDYVFKLCHVLHLQDESPENMDGPWFWLDPYGSAEPQPCVRTRPPEEKELLFFSTAVLARRTSDVLSRSENDTTDGELRISEQYPNVTPFSLLSQLRQRWHTPSSRISPRRRQDYKVEACLGLSNIWTLLRTPEAPEALEAISEWTVLNESPGGYAIMQLQNHCKGLTPGIVVALRRAPTEAWSICIVRWLKSDPSAHIEIGLQMVSKNAIPVRVGFRGKDFATLRSALVLPVLPALRQHQAVLAPAGTYASRRFTLVSDVDRIYVSQCRLLTLDIQTSNLEIFQFEVDPYPI